MRRSGICVVVVTCALAVGCGKVNRSADAGTGDEDAAVSIDAAAPIDASVPPDAIPRSSNLDVLFVIDNSGTMEEEQRQIATAFDPFIGALSAGGELPNLHIGVITTDLGAGPFNISQCTGNGDDGVLQVPIEGSTCPGPEGRFIIDVAAVGGGRDRNYAGTLTETFQCIADRGTFGCGFEQPLEALRRALNNTVENAGFLREDAGLLVIIVSDEDDCSVFDTQMFDTSQNSPDDPLGPLSSFRCFEFGVRCTPDTPRTLGEKSDCAPRPDSEYMTSVSELVAAVEAIKGGRVVVATVVGNPAPVVVGTDEQLNFTLQPSCTTSDGSAVPAVRMGGFASAFGSRGITRSICSPIGGAMMDAANLARSVLLE